MPVYNAEKYLREAIDSILHQTHTNFEFLIFDDGSTDNSVAILQTYTDARIQLFIDGQNLGQPKRYNAGIRAAKGKYIAIMHADDISLPHRFATQVTFLEENEEYALVGSRARLIFGERLSNKMLGVVGDYEYLRCYQILNCPFVHSSIMALTTIYSSYFYDENYKSAEDYELWSRILRKEKVTNISTPLLNYRMHSTKNAKRNKSIQLDNVKHIIKNQFEHMEIDLPSIGLNSLVLNSNSYLKSLNTQELGSVKIWLSWTRNEFQSLFADAVVHHVIKESWLNTCLKSHSGGFKTITTYFSNSALVKWDDPRRFGKLIIKCTIPNTQIQAS